MYWENHKRDVSTCNRKIFFFTKDLVFKTIIHRNVTLGESPSYGETIIIHDATSKGAINYLNLASEILENEQKKLEEANLVSNE